MRSINGILYSYEVMTDEDWIKSLSRTTIEDNKRIQRLCDLIFDDKVHICLTCPASVRLAVNKLKNYYNGHKR